ncbi:MAG: SDR family NAD(P)-dependent oxidoreductase [Gammaproteobacteria bacterium]
MRVLVTGGASGIGKAIAQRILSDYGSDARVALMDRPGAVLDGAVDEMNQGRGQVIGAGGDLADSTVPERVVQDVATAFGGLDAVVSNAGINSPGAMLTCKVEDWDRVFAVNTRAAWLLAKAAHPMLKESGGTIVIVASMSGSNPHANLGPYGPSKAAAIMLTKVLAQEFGPDGIRVNSLSPGMVRTGMTEKVYQDNEVSAGRAALVPLGRVAETDDMADATAFLLSSDSRYLTGHDLVVDGAVTGNHLGRLPGLSSITSG